MGKTDKSDLLVYILNKMANGEILHADDLCSN